MPETTFTGPDLTTLLELDALGLTAVGQHLTVERAVVECRIPVWFEDPFCKACGAQGQARGTVARRLAHVPVGWRPTQLLVHVRRFACTHCRRAWRQDTSSLAEPRARLTRSAVEWGAAGPRPGVHVGLPGSSPPGDLLAHRQQHDPGKSSGHAVRRSPQLQRRRGPRRRRFPRALRSQAGGAPSVWRHTRRGDRYVIIDLPPRTPPGGPARLLDVAPGRSKKVLKNWLAQRDQDWRGQVEVVAMDGFTGFNSAAGEELPAARAVMDLRASCPWLPASSMSAAAASNERSRAGGARRVTGSTRPDAPYAPESTCSPAPRPSISRPCSPTSAAPRPRPPGASTGA